MVPHVTFVAPVETELTWDGTSPCALLKEFRDAMTSDGSTTITNTILPRTFPTAISIHQQQSETTNERRSRKGKGSNDREDEGRGREKYGLPLW